MSDFVRVCGVTDVDTNSALAIDVGDLELAVVNSDGNYYAIFDECSHANVPLSEGDVGHGEIECYLHGSRFDLATGKPLGPPATEPVAVYPCRISGDDVLVDVSAPVDPDALPPQPDNPASISQHHHTQES